MDSNDRYGDRVWCIVHGCDEQVEPGESVCRTHEVEHDWDCSCPDCQMSRAYENAQEPRR